MKNLSDEDIIRQIKNNDQTAFRIFIERYERTVAATVINMLGPCAEADDVGQEVFIRFYRNVGQFKGTSAVSTYLTRIAINLSLNELKRRKIRTLRYVFFKQESDQPDPIYNQAADSDADKSDHNNLVHKALQYLDMKLRAVVVLRLIEGYDTRETADILQIPQGTVLSRLSRGQERLKEILIKLGYKS